MKLKKIIAGIAAAAVAVSAMAINAFAAITNADGGNYVYDVLASGINVTDVYGVTFTISDYDASQGIGGGIGANSPSTGWESHEWGNEGKEITLAGNTVTLLKDAPIFQETDATADDPYAQLWIQEWWGSDITIDNVVVLGADGSALEASAADAGDAAPAEDENNADAAEAEDHNNDADVTDEDEDVDDVDLDEDEDLDEDDDVDFDTDDDEDIDDGDYDEDTNDADDTDDVDAGDNNAADAGDAGVAATSDAPATGNVAVASIAAVMAVAGVAALVSRKRK